MSIVYHSWWNKGVESTAVSLSSTVGDFQSTWCPPVASRHCRRPFICLCWAKALEQSPWWHYIGLIAVSIQKETENTLISAIISGSYFLIAAGYLGGGLPCLSSALWCQYPKRQQCQDSITLNSHREHPLSHIQFTFEYPDFTSHTTHFRNMHPVRAPGL